MRKAFTLIELIISIAILSLVMIFLYKSYASLNASNVFYKKEVSKIKMLELKKKVIFLDFSLAKSKSIKIINQDKNEDVVFLQSSNSMHNRYSPHIAYIVKNSQLYRLESLYAFTTYPLVQGMEFSIESFGKVNGFRVYKSDVNITKSYLIHIDLKNDILLKVSVLS